ncbi:transglycosylase SLT domain-containing protein [Photobacterium sp. DNB23_23_1]|uniref:Lytic transglycosylase F n=1 Tax=Photobacterium pectinilyticum TaxID=2906793 RepID=A0ABT1N816_9GAMM|nr:lytic transglycosylase F [Photobacterium sp. ZSDE20]MCQ1060903.1 lytic transglycosylase F [Photobacterium sp. ZSDE20]MDD1828810.1 lytic transglycosylase F [Photobacterium sp. ZSDE20]
MRTALSFLFIIGVLISSICSAFQITPQKYERYTGDLPVMEEKRVIRVLVAADLGFYYLDRGQPKGLISEMLRLFEKFVSEKTQKKYRIQIIPVHRDQLLPALNAGIGDLVTANITITPKRMKQVDFSHPILTGIQELFITHSVRSPITDIKQLSKKSVWLRASSSYYQSIRRINKQLHKLGKEPMYVHFLEETLQDFEMLQMVQEGIIPMTVLDSHKAEFWDLVTDDLQIHYEYPIRKNSAIGWSFRKDSPEFKAIVDEFVENNRRGTLNGNILFNRYLNSKAWFQKVMSPDSIDKFKELENRFIRYGNMYDINWLIIAAQAFQESGFDQSKRSHAGAIGIMQVLPQTASEPYINISNIQNIENNIHAGVKYMDFIRDRYVTDDDTDELNQLYFALASYNAGPNRIRRLRKVAEERGYDPTQWFNNVEVIVKEEVGMEPITYVGNINRYFTIYKQIFSLQNAAGQRMASSNLLRFKLSR